jgi:hypothetical protein
MITLYHHGKIVEEFADDTAGRARVATLVGHKRLVWRPYTEELRVVWSKGAARDEAEWLATRPAVTVRVMQYGLPFNPITNADAVNDQIYYGHHYQNQRIEIERDRRAAVRTILEAHPDVEPSKAEVDRLTAAVRAACDAIKKSRQKTRSRSETKAMRTRVTELRAQLKDARQRFKDAKQALKDDAAVQAQLKECNELSHTRSIAARKACKAHWGTYTLIEDAHQQSCQNLRGLSPDYDPRFRRFRGEGRISVQLQNGAKVADVLSGEHTQLQIDPVPEEAWTSPVRGERRRLSRTKVRMRIGTDANHKPIWAEWKMILHRPLPENGIIKRATVTKRRRDCRTWRWEINFTVELPAASVERRCGEGIVAVNLGWRQREQGQRLRVLYWRDEFGESGEVLLDDSIIPRLDQVNGLRSLRDEKFDLLRPVLNQWLADHQDILPEWLREKSEHLSKSKSFRRYHALAWQWRENRFEGDALIYRLFASNKREDNSWVYRDEHLERWESNQRGTTLRCRREQYRRFAAELASTYGELLIDGADYREMQSNVKPESSEVKYTTVKLAQRRASPSEFRTILSDAFKSRRGAVTTLSSETLKPTVTCHVCQSHEEWNRVTEISHTCGNCGTTWDQDDNHCRNLLRERCGGDGSAGSSRVSNPVEMTDDATEAAA